MIGAVGAGMNQSPMLTRFVERGLVDCVLVAGRFTLLDDSAAHDLLLAAQRHGVGVIAAGVFNSGVLADAACRRNLRLRPCCGGAHHARARA